MSRPDRDHPVALAVALAVIGAGGAWIGGWLADGKVQDLLFGAAVTLFFGALLGGVVSLLLDNARKLQERRQEQARFVQAVLDDLKDAHDRVERITVKVNAYHSVPAYAKAMDALLEAKIGLRNVERALDNSPDIPGWGPACSAHVLRMRNYLKTIVDEFTREYGDLTGQKKQLADLDAFMDLRHPEPPVYKTEFKDPLECATKLLRKELRRLTA